MPEPEKRKIKLSAKRLVKLRVRAQEMRQEERYQKVIQKLGVMNIIGQGGACNQFFADCCNCCP